MYVPVPDLKGGVWKKHPNLDVEVSNMGRCRSKKTNPSYGCLMIDGYRTMTQRARAGGGDEQKGVLPNAL